MGKREGAEEGVLVAVKIERMIVDRGEEEREERREKSHVLGFHFRPVIEAEDVVDFQRGRARDDGLQGLEGKIFFPARLGDETEPSVGAGGFPGGDLAGQRFHLKPSAACGGEGRFGGRGQGTGALLSTGEIVEHLLYGLSAAEDRFSYPGDLKLNVEVVPLLGGEGEQLGQQIHRLGFCGEPLSGGDPVQEGVFDA